MKRVMVALLVMLLSGCGDDGDALDQPWRAEAQSYAQHQYELCPGIGNACREAGYPITYKSEGRCGCMSSVRGSIVDIGY